jgi:arsenate reductase-like glutaredoxin family protein
VKAQEFLEQAKVAVKETVDASKNKFPKEAAVALARNKATKVVGLRGEADLKKDPPDDDTLAALLLGPTGNLKAPTILVGKTMIVGFNRAAYETLLK